MAEYDLWNELSAKTRQLDMSIRELRVNGTQYAEAEKAYKIELRKTCLSLKAGGMAVGLIDKTCYGVPEVAELRFRRDVASTVYEANKEAINAIKLEMRIIENQIQREWSSKPSNM